MYTGQQLQKLIKSTILLFILFFLVSCVPEDANVTKNNFNYYNVKEYGAFGNDTIVDTIAIQNAIDAASQNGGGTVYFPSGKYLSGQFIVPDKVSLKGEGMDVSTIRAVDHALDGLEFPLFIWIKEADNVTISDLTVDGNGDNQKQGSSLVLYKARNALVTRVKVINSKTIALNVSNVENSHIENSVFDGTKQNTVISFSYDHESYSKGNNTISNNTIINGALDGIIYNNINGIIIGNTIAYNGKDPDVTAGGIYINGQKNVVISENIIYDNDGNGIDVINAQKITVKDNIIYENNSAGVMFSGTTNGIISNNQAYNNGKAPATDQNDGVSILGQSENIIITGNILFDDRLVKVQEYGIEISSESKSILVDNNLLIGNKKGSIRNQSIIRDH